MKRGREIPDSVRARFPDHDALDLLGHPGFLIGRLLEQGDSQELAWLFDAVSHSEVAAWLSRHGGRVLSARSRALWEQVVGPVSPPPTLAAELWPLA
ncbi:MAG: hypothetical protein K8J08_14985 [Thermoanaerobaculia bacterium]|nr:hypothetical protein [Thermoanaerobaculia bacterium]